MADEPNASVGSAEDERRLRDAQLLRESIQEFPGPVAVYDESDRLITCNELYRWVHGAAFERVEAAAGPEGIHYESLVRESARGVVPPDELDSHVADRVRAQREATGEPVDRYYPERGWFRIVKIRTPGGAVVGFATDITELKEKTLALEQARAAAEAANVAKTAFLANMSHELRTPLNAIIGLADALQSGVFGEIENSKHAGYIADIAESGHHLLALISDLLDLAKVESGAMEIERSAFAVTTLLDECRHMLEPIAESRSVRLEMHNGHEAMRLEGDQRKIKQALINVLSNAVKFSHDGGRVRLTTALDDGGFRVVVEDEGIGLDEDKLAVVFQPFGQLYATLASAREGSGLGLPIAQRLVELHGGRIDLASTPGKGTRVTVTLPPDMAVS